MTTDDSHPADHSSEPDAPASPVVPGTLASPDAPESPAASDERDAPEAPEAPAAAAASEVPDERTLEAIATPASVRRAPRISAFVRTGVLLCALVGWLLAILFSGTTGEVRTGVVVLSTIAGAGFGALLGAAAAALADRRSVRARPGARAGRPTGGSPTL